MTIKNNWVDIREGFPDKEMDIVVMIELYRNSDRTEKFHTIMSGKVTIEKDGEKRFNGDFFEFNPFQICNHKIQIKYWCPKSDLMPEGVE